MAAPQAMAMRPMLADRRATSSVAAKVARKLAGLQHLPRAAVDSVTKSRAARSRRAIRVGGVDPLTSADG